MAKGSVVNLTKQDIDTIRLSTSDASRAWAQGQYEKANDRATHLTCSVMESEGSDPNRTRKESLAASQAIKADTFFDIMNTKNAYNVSREDMQTFRTMLYKAEGEKDRAACRHAAFEFLRTKAKVA